MENKLKPKLISKQKYHCSDEYVCLFAQTRAPGGVQSLVEVSKPWISLPAHSIVGKRGPVHVTAKYTLGNTLT